MCYISTSKLANFSLIIYIYHNYCNIHQCNNFFQPNRRFHLHSHFHLLHKVNLNVINIRSILLLITLLSLCETKRYINCLRIVGRITKRRYKQCYPRLLSRNDIVRQQSAFTSQQLPGLLNSLAVWVLLQ